MSTAVRRAAGMAAAWCVGMLASSCISDRIQAPLDDAAGDCAVPLAGFGPGRRLVAIRDFAFAPDTVRIAPGTAVTWVSCEPAGREAHTVTAQDGSWTSPLVAAGDRFTRSFAAAGTFAYTCGPHPHMRAVVIVE
jgi:plastocyanin